MPGRSARVGVIVVTVGEVSAMFEQQAKTAFAPLVAIALQVVAAKLIDHDNDDHLRPCVIGRSEARNREGKAE